VPGNLAAHGLAVHGQVVAAVFGQWKRIMAILTYPLRHSASLIVRVMQFVNTGSALESLASGGQSQRSFARNPTMGTLLARLDNSITPLFMPHRQAVEHVPQELPSGQELLHQERKRLLCVGSNR
jgi:hypothetical protein